MKLEIGSVISDLRRKHDLTREELAQGICDSAILLDYERNISSPTIDELALLAEKLKVDLSFFFTSIQAPIYNYIETIKLLVNRQMRVQNYKTVYDIVQNELPNAFDKSISFYQFLKWHEGISSYYLFDRKQDALGILNEALQITKGKKEIIHLQEIEILSSIGLLHYETGDYKEAIPVFTHALELLENIPHLKQEGKVYVRILNTLAQTLTKVGCYSESLSLALRAINVCHSIDSIYLLGDLHASVGMNLLFLNKVEKAERHIEQAKTIYMLKNSLECVQSLEENANRILANFENQASTGEI